MIRDFATCSKAVDYCWRTQRLVVAIGLILIIAVPVAMAQSSKCNRAQAIVDEVKIPPASSSAEHRAILAKLEIAKTLCPSLAEIWKLAYCSAVALDNKGKAEFYRKRAALSGVRELQCGGSDPASAQAPPPLPSYVRQKFALVVGIGKFKDPKIPTLRFTAKDARDFADYLVDRANFIRSNVTLLIDEAASRANILNGLQQLILKTREDDLVVLYVSSHGSPHKTSQGLGGIGYLVTHDTSLDNIWVDAIEYQDFARKAALIKARRMVSFLDTCFSGQAFRVGGAKQLSIEGAGVGQQTAEMFLSGEGTYVITSSRADEQSWESNRLDNSFFTYYLIEALKGGSEPPTVKEVFDELTYKVAQAVAEEKGAGQHPQIHPTDGVGDVKIGVIPKLNIVDQE